MSLRRLVRDTGRYVKLGWRLRAYVHGRRSRADLVRFAALIPVSGAWRGRPPRPARIRLDPRWTVTVRDRSELLGMADVFERGDYTFEGSPGVIVDLGANVGFASLYFAQRYPAARIVAVEADPRTFERLAGNVADVPAITPVLRAIADDSGTVTFYSSRRSMSSSLVQRSPDQRPVSVPASTLEDLLDELGLRHVDLLKIDIEGAEHEVFETGGLERVDRILAEIHYDLAPGMDERWLRERLDGFSCQFALLEPPDRYMLRASRPG